MVLTTGRIRFVPSLAPTPRARPERAMEKKTRVWAVLHNECELQLGWFGVKRRCRRLRWAPPSKSSPKSPKTQLRLATLRPETSAKWPHHHRFASFQARLFGETHYWGRRTGGFRQKRWRRSVVLGSAGWVSLAIRRESAVVTARATARFHRGSERFSCHELAQQPNLALGCRCFGIK